MFSRVVYGDLQQILTVVAFVLIAGGFLVFVLKAVFMKKSRRDRMASLPLEEEEKTRAAREGVPRKRRAEKREDADPERKGDDER